MNQLVRDLPTGQKFEDFIVKRLWEREQLIGKRIEGKHPGFDILVEEPEIKIECKRDLKSKQTGNIAIEFECYRKPSGITSTTADYWAICYFHNQQWRYGYVKVEVLRKACEGLRWVSGGDDMLSKMYLMKVTDFLKIKQAFVVQR